jgi:hypothetical protein
MRSVPEGDIAVYIDALKPVNGSVARALSRIAMHPVATAQGERGFSKVAWIKSARRNRLNPAALRALSILASNGASAVQPVIDITRRFLDGTPRTATETAFSSDGVDSETASAADGDSDEYGYPDAGP